MSKKRSPRSVAAETRTREKFYQDHFIAEFDDCQAERIWKRDMTMLVIGAVIVLVLLMGGVI